MIRKSCVCVFVMSLCHYVTYIVILKDVSCMATIVGWAETVEYVSW
jgi:hypothetical protein